MTCLYNMDSDDVVFDIETKRSFNEAGISARDGGSFEKLGVSVVGAYVYGLGQYLTFEEHEIPEFEKLLQRAGRVVGFNIRHFDLAVLQPYISWNLKNLPALDLMDDVKKSLGHRLYLDSLAEATLGVRKSGDGLQALKWYKEGKMGEIKKYCLKDVEITKNLYDFGRQNGHVLFYSRSAGGRVAIPVAWNKPEKSGTEKNVQLKIF
ncbi:MAG: ribonuclease H-like domain-containing protein [Candidatus Giovannonibacteria bacterium]|nr:MAG: ribonuclease H-like domain-containing protein [Candidatus Giovannonibacteria bacterium]